MLPLAKRGCVAKSHSYGELGLDVDPATKLFTRARISTPPTMNVSSGPSWGRLIVWAPGLLERESARGSDFPDVVTRYR
jgi:hypothetical protein